MAQFARHFRTYHLVSDASPDPYRMIHVRPDDSRELVRLHADTLDGQDAYVIEGPYLPGGEQGERGSAACE